MHEWALAEGIVLTVLKNSGGRKVKKVKLKIGELQQLSIEALKFAMEQLSIEAQDEKIKVEIQIEPAEFECSSCRHIWKPSNFKTNKETNELIHFIPEISKILMKCPRCGSIDFEIRRGRGIWIDSLVIQE